MQEELIKKLQGDKGNIPKILLLFRETLDDAKYEQININNISCLENNDLYNVAFETLFDYEILTIKGCEIKDRMINPSLYFRSWSDNMRMIVYVSPYKGDQEIK